MSAVDSLWLQALSRIQSQIGSTPTFKTMFEPSRLLAIEAGQALVEVPNRFVRDQMRKNRHDVMIRGVLQELVGEPVDVEFVIAQGDDRREIGGREYRPVREDAESEPLAGVLGEGEVGAPRVEHPGATRAPSAGPVVGLINPKYTFGTFVIGSHSHFSHAAAKAVADSPARAYNPLFIYGGVGLGKTHLMHAIANQILDRQPHLKVAYLSSEKFTNELINAIKEDRMLDFKNRYRTIDLLLIDDIQFIEGKERTQEEFFHTFNALHESGKQIVMTSDRAPKDISALEARLRSRFEWGLITDIQSPDLETRIAILKKKAEQDLIDAPDDMFHYIAAAYPNNVRELEGAFIRVMAYASLSNAVPTIELARQALGAITPHRQVTVPVINDLVAAYFHLEVADLVGSRRTKDISQARQIAMYLARDLTDLSLSIIGSKFGGRDHTTVMHAIDKVKGQITKDTQLAGDVQKLHSQLRA
jgi:chromosomal replication initiator protein